MPKEYEKLLASNKAWAKRKVEQDPEYFTRLVNTQTPHYLWIGCSDSRVPPNEITQTAPGDVFIHRNVANLVVHTDMNLLSVLQYAVEVLEVKDVIVCGHYGCGGVKAAMNRDYHGLIDNWLRNIKDIYRFHQETIEKMPEEKRFDTLVRLNVREQALNLAKTSIIQKAWAKSTDGGPYIHGWVYDLHDGIIDTVSRMSADETYLEDIYAFKDFTDDNVG